METLWYKAHAFTGAPVGGYLFAIDDDNDVLVYDNIAHRFTTCHRLTAAEQDEIRAAFARREAEREALAKRAAEREALAAHIMAVGTLADHCGSVRILDGDDGSSFAIDGPPERAVWFCRPGEYWKSPYDAEIIARLHALSA